MSRPALLDLFCGAGGAAMGYRRAGFDVVGVDIKPQPRYPFRFVQADAMTLLSELLEDRPLAFYIDDEIFPVDAIHASPPCKKFSMMSRNTKTAGRHEDLLTPARALLQPAGCPWVIENVPGAPMRADYLLCGCMFGLPGLRRERWFETSWRGFAMNLAHDHSEPCVTVVGGGPDYGVRQRAANLATKKRAMGIDWMSRDELSQAIPPAYTEYIGRQLLDYMAVSA